MASATTRWHADDGVWETTGRGRDVLADPRLNRGTAFSDAERRALDLVGLVPPQVLTLEQQATRAYGQYLEQPSDLAKNVYLTALHDRNEVLFYKLLSDHLAEMLPVVYTPTVGEAIERYSYEYRRPRGIYLSVDAPEDLERSLRAPRLGPDEVDLIVATDAQAILGIGDWGVGGIDIAVGKLAVYTAAAGVDPARTLAVMLDVGTNRRELIDDDLYLGTRHARAERDVYDAFIGRYVEAATKLFPSALLHWEDFGPSNARRILRRYQGEILTFNDDIQGTGAVNLAALLVGAKVGGTPLRDHRVVVFGAGTAGMGIADQLRGAMAGAGLNDADAVRHFWCVDRHGLLVDDMEGLLDFQAPYARPAAEVIDWARDPRVGGVALAEVVRQVRPTVLIGTSAQPGAFTKQIITHMARYVERPIILPMSNPTHLAEAVPADLLAWTDGRGLVATGSPFAPVVYGGRTFAIGQANNALVFPGLGLGAIVARARHITDSMVTASARALADLVDVDVAGVALLPPMDHLASTSVAVASSVVRAALDDGVAGVALRDEEIQTAVRRAMWRPVYRPIRAL